jgi:hypothetical protein
MKLRECNAARGARSAPRSRNRAPVPQGLEPGALALLSGCELTGDERRSPVVMSTKRPRRRLYSTDACAEHPKARSPVPVQCYYSEEVPMVEAQLSAPARGSSETKPWTLPELTRRRLRKSPPHLRRGWSASANGANTLRTLLQHQRRPDLKYVGSRRDDYYSSIDMPPQAPADAAYFALPTICRRNGFPMSCASDQTRLQEPNTSWRCCYQHYRRLLGRSGTQLVQWLVVFWPRF